MTKYADGSLVIPPKTLAAVIAAMLAASGAAPVVGSHFGLGDAAAIASVAAEAKKSADEAKATAAKALDRADALALNVVTLTDALEKLDDKMDAQSAQLNQIIGKLDARQ